MRKTLLLVLLAINIAAQAQNESFKTFSLKEAVDYGIKNNLTAKNAKLSETQAVARNKELLLYRSAPDQCKFRLLVLCHQASYPGHI
jgi:hypothetical protein